MAKLPPIEVFEITCRIAKEQLGSTLAALIKEGVEDIHHKLVTLIPTFRSNNRPQPVDGQPPRSTLDVLTDWIKDNPTFRAVDACRVVEATGRSKTSAYPALSALVDQGMLKKLGPGNYARADVKQIAPPKKKARRKGKRKSQRTFTKTGAEVILSYMQRNHGRANTAKLIEMFEKEGRQGNTAHGTLHRLMKDKLIKRLDAGHYELAAKATKPATNGGEPAAEVTNG